MNAFVSRYCQFWLMSFGITSLIALILGKEDRGLIMWIFTSFSLGGAIILTSKEKIANWKQQYLQVFLVDFSSEEIAWISGLFIGIELFSTLLYLQFANLIFSLILG
ncbi:MAG: hypothetical protein UT55_C0050G0001, partial [Candidatus Peregrinibacteria bacterium GW2011_GWE2_39_6]